MRGYSSTRHSESRRGWPRQRAVYACARVVRRVWSRVRPHIPTKHEAPKVRGMRKIHVLGRVCRSGKRPRGRDGICASVYL
eukprot:scaffold11973_cov112-Isochrysis_galbana.AAC.3